jgi:flagellar hook-length control protein FliK
VPLAGVAIEIASKALAGKNHFAIRLDPPELGRIEVHLDVHRDGRVTSHLVADRKDTLDFFRRDAAGLERALQDAGLKTSDNGLQFSLRDQQNAWQQQQQQQQQANSANSVRLVADDGLPAIDATQTGVRLSYRSGGLDIRV